MITSIQNGKVTDCVLFKQELHEKAYKTSGASDFSDYVKRANESFFQSEWYKKIVEPHGANAGLAGNANVSGDTEFP